MPAPSRPATPPASLRLRPWQRVAILLLAPAVAGGVTAWHHEVRRANRSEATFAQARRLTAEATVILWLDARDARERGDVPLGWALGLAEETWENDLPKVLEAWQPGAVLFVFCGGGSCGRGENVAQRLRRETGLPGIQVIPEGVDAARRLHEQLAAEKALR